MSLINVDIGRLFKLEKGTFYGKNIYKKIIFRYGLALRDHDIDVIRSRTNTLVNRYPLMDVMKNTSLF